MTPMANIRESKAILENEILQLVHEFEAKWPGIYIGTCSKFESNTYHGPITSVKMEVIIKDGMEG